MVFPWNILLNHCRSPYKKRHESPWIMVIVTMIISWSYHCHITIPITSPLAIVIISYQHESPIHNHNHNHYHIIIPIISLIDPWFIHSVLTKSHFFSPVHHQPGQRARAWQLAKCCSNSWGPWGTHGAAGAAGEVMTIFWWWLWL